MPDRPACPRILVVEDDRDHRDLICEALTLAYGPAAAARVVGVATARECLLQELDQFDVVLLDYHLPDADGLELLKTLGKQWDVPVVFVTGENDAEVAAEAIRHGAQDYVVKLGDYLFAIPVLVDKSIRQHRMQRENERLRRDLQSALEQLQDKNAELERSLEQVRHLAATDHLTHLANRRQFVAELERCYSAAKRYGHDLTCAMCDLDRYKQLNDTRGHQVGDEVLMLTAEVIRESLRGSDVAARYGGDEFVLLLPHTGRDEAESLLGRLTETVRGRSAAHPSLDQGLTLSAGLASLRANAPESPDALVTMADRALYAAKAQGGGAVVAWGDSTVGAAGP